MKCAYVAQNRDMKSVCELSGLQSHELIALLIDAYHTLVQHYAYMQGTE